MGLFKKWSFWILLPLCGGTDSSSVAAIVGCMCQLVVKEIAKGDEQDKADAIRIGNYTDGKFPIDSKEFAKRIFYTVYIGSENSSEAKKMRAKVLADEIGSWHLDVCIDGVVSSLLSLFQTLGKDHVIRLTLQGQVDGGSNVENLGLQNIQARIRMVLAFMLASLLPWYDCSAADINPIGSISKQDLRTFLRWAANHLGYSSLAEIEAAPPTAELSLFVPTTARFNSTLYMKQLDEVDMAMTYEELSVYGRLRKIFRCSPVSMFKNLCYKWGATLTPSEVADKVKHFFTYYSINRHKMTVSTPPYHAESYSPEDNRFDLRQFLYNARWPYQFRKMDDLVQELNGDKVAFKESCNNEKLGATAGVGGVGAVAAAAGDPKARI
ncbi:Glutamine-dependent NAD(+) synthetase [Hibiscus syriacus]|uniref:Glutamine-dependent NAD(+) synthetase n=1 Tax=Hibiscus syriacus TaxID=106335 RepID=A0A6A2ZT95_HIBSY|nr:Glutamine-dependent NAD(+) synthetase [Hibiscus syriacus]